MTAGWMWRFSLLVFCCAGAAAISPLRSYAAATWETLPAPQVLPLPRASGYVQSNGAGIYFAVFGAGPPIILLHGGLANSDYWGDQIAPLSAKYEVIIIDSRGHGRSTRDSRPFSYDLMTSDVLAVMDILHLKTAAVAGWSDGAVIGLTMAIKHPDRINRLFFFAGNADPSGLSGNARSHATVTQYYARTAREYDRLSKTPRDYVNFVGALVEMWRTQPNFSAAELRRVRVPTAIVTGDHDELIRLDHMKYLARTIAGARLIVLNRTSHFAMLQNPAAFNGALLGFLDGR